MRKQIQEKALAVKAEIVKEAQNGAESVAVLQKYLEEDIPSLFEELRQSQAERKHTEELMLK